jgi:asparagine synthase (glutamine-hydrolysing)
MAETIIHRGPDDDGYFVSPPIGMAARRLSIVDVAGGHMPLSNEDGSVWVVYNGEIYNAPDLREELLASGHIFRTRGDTEIIVHAYEQWGRECITHLRGMFAIGLWDASRRRLLLARDRFGVKPLYYAVNAVRFAFGSEMRPVLAGAGIAPKADLASLRHALTYGMPPAPRTVFEGVWSLPPAHWLEIDAACTNLLKPHCYWDISVPPDADRAPHDDIPDQFLALLREAVRIRLMSDVPIGALLSGGIDSSSLVALLQECSGGRTTTATLSLHPSAWPRGD